MSQAVTSEGYRKRERECRLVDQTISLVRLPILENEGKKELVIGLFFDGGTYCTTIGRAKIAVVLPARQKAVILTQYHVDRGDLIPKKMKYYPEGTQTYRHYDKQLSEREL